MIHHPYMVFLWFAYAIYSGVFRGRSTAMWGSMIIMHIWMFAP